MAREGSKSLRSKGHLLCFLAPPPFHRKFRSAGGKVADLLKAPGYAKLSRLLP
jgi:hypothetical protein